jgi:hypothetical protein
VTTSITIDRTALSLPDLVITGDSTGADFHLPEDGIGRPNFAMRRGYAPTSRLISGQQLLSAVADVGSLSLRIYAHGTSTADLDVNRAALTAALTQWAFQLTLTVDGSAETYWCDPEFPTWGPVDSGEVAAFMSIATITVPVQPGSA